MRFMKRSGIARRAGFKIIGWTLALVLLVAAGMAVATFVPGVVSKAIGALVVGWALFALFTLSFFRDPSPKVPSDPAAIVSPAHGTVDIIEETSEPEFMGGPCRRISIFLSVFDVHIQNAPVSAEIAFMKHSPGKFLNAMRKDCSTKNENVLIGFNATDREDEKISVRLIAGLIARRIVPWVGIKDTLVRGERIGLIQFGSRVDLHLPLATSVNVKLGDKVVGGETVVAMRI